MEFALRLEGVPNLSIPISSSSSSSSNEIRRIQHYQCNDCDENYDNNNNSNSNSSVRYCTICAAEMVPVYANIDSSNDDNNHRNLLENLFEFLGTDLREEIENAMNNSNNSRSISQSYLETLGKVVLDSRQGLLYDITIKVGPFTVMGIPATFGSLPFPILTAEIINGIPEHGEALLQDQVKDKIVLLKRGVVSFAQKAMNAQKSGCIAVIIGQTADMWPFVMSDTTKEIDTFDLKIQIPVLMISKQDCTIIEKMLTKTNENSNNTFECRINCGEMKQDCSICQEDMIENETILKLACRHAYHQQCITNWLSKHNTCALCRAEMPKEDKVQKVNRQREDTHRLPYFR